jgi:hypothetical protein
MVTVVAAALVIGDLTDLEMRHWWLTHALTTDTVAGLLVLLITVLVVDQVVRIRQLQDRSLAVGAQTAIMMAQANRSASAVSAAIRGSGDRSTALDELRTYMLMLLVGAPVLIDGKVSRTFLEDAQYLGGELAHALTVTAKPTGSYSTDRIDHAIGRLKKASAPLITALTTDERTAAVGIDVG